MFQGVIAGLHTSDERFTDVSDVWSPVNLTRQITMLRRLTPIQGENVHVVSGLVDHKGMPLGQADLCELDRAG